MSRLRSFLRSFNKNVIGKKKFKAFLMLIFDKQYRTDINRLFFLTRGCTRSELKSIHYKDLVPGHKVVYPAYALDLLSQTEELPPMRVVWDPNRHVYVIVDGNHRFPAFMLKARYGFSEHITCEVIS